MQQSVRRFRERFRRPRAATGAVAWAVAVLGLLAAPGTLPAEDAAGRHPPGGVVVPLEGATFNHFGITASVDGRTAFLMLDTGSPMTILDADFYRRCAPADAAAKEPARCLRMATLNHQPVLSGRIGEIRAGAMRFGGASVAVTDLSGISGLGSRGYHGPVAAGILGADLLARYNAVIDWSRRLVYFDADATGRSEIGQSAVRQGWTAIPMEFTSGRHFAVPCTLGGGAYHLIVDTGAALTQLDASLWGPADFSQNWLRGYATGLSSHTLVAPVTLTGCRIGTFPVADSVAVVGRCEGSLYHETTRAPGRMVGLLGSDWLAVRGGIIDINGMTLYLK